MGRLSMSVSRNGIGVTYKCVDRHGMLRKLDGKEGCKDMSDKCFKCKFCYAEMSAFNATRLLNSYGKSKHTKVTCMLENCKFCDSENQICTNEKIYLADDHYCIGGCDDGWEIDEQDEDE